MRLLKKLWIAVLFISTNILAGEKAIISIGADSLKEVQSTISTSVELIQKNETVALIRLDKKQVGVLSNIMHEKFHRCPGFTRYDSEAQAIEEIASWETAKSMKGIFSLDYVIDQKDLVQPLVEQVDEVSVVQIISKLSSFTSRYHKSKTGLKAVNWLKSHWESMAKNRSDVSVELFKHSRTPQPSVILTFEGSEDPDQVIVVGGHVDSIAKSFFGGVSKEAPGADDNASGIATMTEVIRILIQNDYRPKKTIKFMAYAAEEVGLVGSREIANDFKNRSVNVIGVMQLDMTNFKGSDEDIVLMTDYTNETQNNFITSLIDTYVKVKWGTDRCGYGCSDHASWTSAGFPASVPFESKMREMNHNIHSKRDTLKVSDNHAFHAVKFTKLALSYVVELDR